MNDNPIVAEVRAARKEILDAYNGDVQAMLRDMMKKQHERGRTFLKKPDTEGSRAGTADDPAQK